MRSSVRTKTRMTFVASWRGAAFGGRAGRGLGLALMGSLRGRMAAVEVGEFAHEVVEAAVGGRQFAQHREGEERGPARPEKQGEVGQVATGDHRLGDRSSGSMGV